MSETTAPGKPESAVPAQAKQNGKGFLTREDLQDRATFCFEPHVVTLPEMHGKKVELRPVSHRERQAIQRQMPDDPRQFTVKQRAKTFSRYVSNPDLTEDEWAELLPDMPDRAVQRIEREIADLMFVDESEEASAAREFPEGE